MGKNSPIDVTPNMALPVNLALLAELDKIEEQRARHLRPQVAADVQIRFETAGAGFRLEAQRVRRSACHPVVDIGAEVEHPARRLILRHCKLDGQERRVVDLDAALLHRRDQKVFVALALEHRGEQLHQRRPADRRLQVEPGAVGGDAHVEIAAKRRVPPLDRRRPLAFGCRWPSAPVIASKPDCPSFAMVCLEPARIGHYVRGQHRSRDRDRQAATIPCQI